MIYQVTNTQRKSWNIKKKTRRKVNMLQCPCKQFKTNEFQNRMFLKPSSYYKYRGDNLQHSVVNNNETQSRNSRAVVISTHACLRFNSSMSLLLGAFDCCECNKKIVSNWQVIFNSYFFLSSYLVARSIVFILTSVFCLHGTSLQLTKNSSGLLKDLEISSQRTCQRWATWNISCFFFGWGRRFLHVLSETDLNGYHSNWFITCVEYGYYRWSFSAVIKLSLRQH